MINPISFFRSPFYPYSRSYPRNPYYASNSMLKDKQEILDDNQSAHTEIRKAGDTNNQDQENIHEKKSSKHYHIGPIFINVNGFSDKEEPILEISGQKLYLDDFIILSLLFFFYKEDVKDDTLFMILILLLIS